jgi:hypothetical protein
MRVGDESWVLIDAWLVFCGRLAAGGARAMARGLEDGALDDPADARETTAQIDA